MMSDELVGRRMLRIGWYSSSDGCEKKMIERVERVIDEMCSLAGKKCPDAPSATNRPVRYVFVLSLPVANNFFHSCRQCVVA